LAALIVATLVWWRGQRQPKEIVLSGTLEARTVEVGSLTGGRVVRVLVDEGQRVAAGQMIVQLETTTIDRQLDEQRAAIEAAKANLAKALAGPRAEEIAQAAAVASNDERDRRRLEHLWRDGIVAKQMYDDAATKAKTSGEQLLMLKRGTRKEDIDAARAEVERQQKHLETLMKQRAETDVTAPNAGTVQSMVLRPGDLVAPNQPVAEILEPDELWVRVYVPGTQVPLVSVGQAVRVRIDTGEMFPGHVATIASKGEYTPRNVQTRAQRIEEVFAVKVLVDPNPRLKAGMAADVDLGVKGTLE
jgi:multidrug efflux pump subunit AcrA (membrane-fusion protein)